MTESILDDDRVILTLDGGGTSFRFSAMRGGEPIVDTWTTPSHGDDLNLCLATILAGFESVRDQCPVAPVAISFAFPGPSNYPDGIVGDLGNLPCFRGGIALGPMLEDRFQMKVFIQNDGNMFAYGEALFGFLPWMNQLLLDAGIARTSKSLIGITLGTGFGAGLYANGTYLSGDNWMAGEIWLLRHKLQPQLNAEEGACIRAIQRAYAQAACIPLEHAPDPKVIEAIAAGVTPGNQQAAVTAYRRLGEVVGDAVASAVTLVDAPVVVGGGLSNAKHHFLPSMVDEMNGYFRRPDGSPLRRLTQEVFDLDTPEGIDGFLQRKVVQVPVYGSARVVPYDSSHYIGVGVSKLGTSKAIAMGAYANALKLLDSPDSFFI